jgi:mediator of RNA polymerase II transcription subunit 13
MYSSFSCDRYQDDWLKISTNSLTHWEKAPFEPYALPKSINYAVVCPDIDPLTCAATDFFQQLGTGESTSLSFVKEVMLKHDRNWFLLKNANKF